MDITPQEGDFYLVAFDDDEGVTKTCILRAGPAVGSCALLDCNKTVFSGLWYRPASAKASAKSAVMAVWVPTNPEPCVCAHQIVGAPLAVEATRRGVRLRGDAQATLREAARFATMMW